jgi:hypothetical protein
MMMPLHGIPLALQVGIRMGLLLALARARNSNEAHSHVHAQRPAPAGQAPLIGDPLPMRFDGGCLVPTIV